MSGYALKITEDGSSPAAAVTVKGIQLANNVHTDRPLGTASRCIGIEALIEQLQLNLLKTIGP